MRKKVCVILSNKQKSKLPVHKLLHSTPPPPMTLFIFAKNVNTVRIPLFPNCCFKLPLLFLRGGRGGEATKEAVVSRRLQTPVVLQAVNTSLFTTGNGAHLDLGSLSAGKVSDYNKPSKTQGLHSLKKQQGLIIRERHQMSMTKTKQKQKKSFI